MCYPCTKCNKCGKYSVIGTLYDGTPRPRCGKCGGPVDLASGQCVDCGAQVKAPPPPPPGVPSRRATSY